MTPGSGRTRPVGIPQDSVIVAADSHEVAWQDPACPPDCTLHVTDLQGGPGARLTLPIQAAGAVCAIATSVLLAGAAPDKAVFRRAAEMALADAKPSGANDFKIELARRIVTRALLLAAAGTPARLPALPASPFAVPPGVLHV